jgi:hypothetical protein
MQWPPDFEAEEARRTRLRRIIISTPDPRETAEEYYSNNPIRFIKDNCITYDPRNPSKGLPAKMPFIPFPKQEELVTWLVDCLNDEEDGLIEKSRDMGATWICAAVSVWIWLFVEGGAVGWGSRKEAYVDRLGDPDSIFEKIRMIIRNLPSYLVPEQFNEKEHLTFMKCLNPSNNSNIAGEAGDNIGRGGRKSIYFKDESAHYERAELIEASLGDNTNVQIDISSVNGEGNVFHRKRFAGIVRTFIFDWRDHPAKTQAWYDKRKAKAEAEGLTAEFAQEVDRDYSSAVEGVFIPAEWVKACLDAHKVLGIEPVGTKSTGLDVADDGGDTNALINAHGILVNHIEQWGKGDTDYTAKRAYEFTTTNNSDELTYDSVGVGAGIKGAFAGILRAAIDELEKQIHEEQDEDSIGALSKQHEDLVTMGLALKVTGFAAGGGVVNPTEEYVKDKKNKDMFANIKAQAWWVVRDRCLKTYRAVVEKKPYNPADILSIDSKCKLAMELVSELSRPKKQYDAVGRIKVESKKDMKKRGIPSPNLADALIMCYAPKQQIAIPQVRGL